ncbi:MAG: metal ABC transporter permease, partial [Chlamydiae bacterium]|nr:metal ABC transporter permease [Chlamydiota bacterium]
ICTFFLYRKFQAICFDEEQATLQGLPTQSLYILMLGLVALAVVVLIQVVGSILVISMLTMPAAIASRLAHTLSSIMKRAIILGMCFSALGTCLSYILNWSPGATITLLATGCYAWFLLPLPRIAQGKRNN